jgi:hypothetical protein
MLFCFQIGLLLCITSNNVALVLYCCCFVSLVAMLFCFQIGLLFYITSNNVALVLYCCCCVSLVAMLLCITRSDVVLYHS